MRTHLTGEAFRSIEELRRGLNEPETTVVLEEGQRQMVLLALAMLAVERPGFLHTLEEIALKMDNVVEGKPDTFSRLCVIHAKASE